MVRCSPRTPHAAKAPTIGAASLEPRTAMDANSDGFALPLVLRLGSARPADHDRRFVRECVGRPVRGSRLAARGWKIHGWTVRGEHLTMRDEGVRILVR